MAALDLTCDLWNPAGSRSVGRWWGSESFPFSQVWEVTLARHICDTSGSPSSHLLTPQLPRGSPQLLPPPLIISNLHHLHLITLSPALAFAPFSPISTAVFLCLYVFRAFFFFLSSICQHPCVLQAWGKQEHRCPISGLGLSGSPCRWTGWEEDEESPWDSQGKVRRTHSLWSALILLPIWEEACICCRHTTLLKHQCLPPLTPCPGKWVGKPILEVRFPSEGYSSLQGWSFLL